MFHSGGTVGWFKILMLTKIVPTAFFAFPKFFVWTFYTMNLEKVRDQNKVKNHEIENKLEQKSKEEGKTVRELKYETREIASF